MFESECGQCRISHKRPRDLSFEHLVLQKLPKSLSGPDYADVDLS
jgi:hypothetical protein